MDRLFVKEFQPLIGLSPWGAKVGFASTLALDFGRETVTPYGGRTWVRGEWHLWFNSCSWRVERSGRIAIASGDPRRALARAISRIEFGPLDGVVVDSSTLDLRLAFRNGIAIVTFTDHRYRSAQWSLFSAGKDTVVADAGGLLRRETPAIGIPVLPPTV